MISILYVDDDTPISNLVKQYLEGDGAFSVDTIESLSVALTKITHHPYDAIVSDYLDLI